MSGQVGNKFGITTVSTSFVAWQDAFVGRSEKFKSTIAKVTQVGEQLVVVLSDEI